MRYQMLKVKRIPYFYRFEATNDLDAFEEFEKCGQNARELRSLDGSFRLIGYRDNGGNKHLNYEHLITSAKEDNENESRSEATEGTA